jgi:hypothetical protein
LKLALTTEEESSQLRRLNEALDSNRFDPCLAYQLEAAGIQAKVLSRKLGMEPTEDEDVDIAVDSLQTKVDAPMQAKAQPTDAAQPADDDYLPNFEEMDADELHAQETAATRIQAIQRGKHDRKMVMEKKVQPTDVVQPTDAAQPEDELPNFEEMVAEELLAQELAATRIQAIQRGKHDRKMVGEKKSGRP